MSQWKEIADILRDHKSVKDVVEAADYIIIQWRATGIVNRGPLDRLAKALKVFQRERVPGPPDPEVPPRPEPFA